MQRLRELGISGAFVAVTALFFVWGFITSNNDPLLMSLRALFQLNYTEALLTQLVFFLAYGLMSLPAAALGNRLGPVPTILAALAAMVLGCLAVRASVVFDRFPVILAALFILAIGITTLQVAANPLVAALGPAQTSHFRLNFSQTFNSLGVVVGVHYGAAVMLGDRAIARSSGAIADPAVRREALGAVEHAFGMMALMLAGLWVLTWTQRRRIAVASAAQAPAVAAPVGQALRSRWARLGALAIGLYVGAEVSIGSMMIAFLHQPAVLGVSFAEGGRLLANLYWGGALVGRFVGSLLLTRVSAERLLAGAALAAGLLCLVVLVASGPLAGGAALGVGLFNSIMFPTIFSITLERSHAPHSSTSGLLCLAIVGGALLPFLVGRLSDSVGLGAAFVVPAIAYAAIAMFALGAIRTARARS